MSNKADMRCARLKSRLDQRCRRDDTGGMNFIQRIMFEARLAAQRQLRASVPQSFVSQVRKAATFRWSGRGGWGKLKAPKVFVPQLLAA